MRIRSKFIALTAGVSGLFLISIALYFLILAPLTTMQREIGDFQELDRAAAEVQAQVNLLLHRQLKTQRQAFERALDRFDRAQKAMGQVVVLVNANAAVAEAVKAVVDLGPPTQTKCAEILGTLDALREAGARSSIPVDNRDWLSLTRSSFAGVGTEALAYQLNRLATQVGSVNDVLNATRLVVEKKDDDIRGEVLGIEQQSGLAGLAVILVAVGAGVLLSLTFARDLVRALSSLGSRLSQVKEGNLGVRFAVNRTDELGGLARDLDAVIETVSQAFRRIQQAAHSNEMVKSRLLDSVGTATASTVEIEAGSASILGQLQKVDVRLGSSDEELRIILSLLQGFRTRLQTQAVDIEGATLAVTELADGIGRVSQLSDQNQQEVETLLNEATHGREVFEDTFAKVEQVIESVSDIQSLATTIAEIASQTNILSLNAAIEAAHAGDAGKGFAVVADEISHLATASSESSAQIARTVADVVARIQEAAASRTGTLETFDAMGEQVIGHHFTGGVGVAQ